ncbi:MAG TPA: DUF1508 domain-containing protein [Candidatus Krumholzibacteria bacterium]|nr:DUF1508 domain-containing protein [Candidatus Krumholzibacteria bacterium]
MSARDGRIVLTLSGPIVRKAVRAMGHFVIYIDNFGDFRWYLMDEDGHRIADATASYRSRSECEHAIKNIQRTIARAKLESPLPRVETLV